MHYRGVMVLGRCVTLDGDEKRAALDAVSDPRMPGRSAEARGPIARSLLPQRFALSLEEASVKVSASPPADNDEDLDLPVWAGVVPLKESWGDPIDAPTDPQVPDYVRTWTR